MSKNIPFAYRIGWSKFDLYYYGIRYSKNCHPSDLWTKYFTSSKIVKNIRNILGEPDVIEIRKTFNNKYLCIKWEKRILSLVVQDKKYLNHWRSLNGNSNNWSTEGFVCVKDVNNNIYHVKKDNYLIKCDILKHITAGKTTGVDIHGEHHFIDTNDKRLKTGELINVNKYYGYSKNKVCVKDEDGNYKQVTKDYFQNHKLKSNRYKKIKMKNITTKEHQDFDKEEYEKLDKQMWYPVHCKYMYVTPFGTFSNYQNIPEQYRMLFPKSFVLHSDKTITLRQATATKNGTKGKMNIFEYIGKTPRELGYYRKELC